LYSLINVTLDDLFDVVGWRQSGVTEVRKSWVVASIQVGTLKFIKLYWSFEFCLYEFGTV